MLGFVGGYRAQSAPVIGLEAVCGSVKPTAGQPAMKSVGMMGDRGHGRFQHNSAFRHAFSQPLLGMRGSSADRSLVRLSALADSEAERGKSEGPALDYHQYPQPGKIATAITKPHTTQEDLSLAYSPGVAEPVKKIADQAEDAYRYTNKGNLVAVVTDGSAILGLGNLGPLAAKPVMEGKVLLMKACANVDGIDIEIERKSIDQFVETVRSISSGFGVIHLEDIKAPECFEIERRLIEVCDIPVFHDDQHGTAITIAAGLQNALDIQGKSLEQVRVVCVGAGAAGIASLNLLSAMGLPKDNITLVDSQGIVHTRRPDLNPYKMAYAQETEKRTLEEAMIGADVFIGVSQADLLTPQMLRAMGEKPIVFGLANPDPEIKPELAKSTRSDVIMATGRSDYPNQVNNVLGFPYILRGALNVRATAINTEMKMAAVEAIRQIAREEALIDVSNSYDEGDTQFGAEYILPKPTDPRLRERVTQAVEEAAIRSGVARVGL